jgi:hypothetical protein
MGILNEIKKHELTKLTTNSVVIGVLGVTSWYAGSEAYDVNLRITKIKQAITDESNRTIIATSGTPEPIGSIVGVPASLRAPKTEADPNSPRELNAQKQELDLTWWAYTTSSAITGLLAAGIFWTAADRRIRYFFNGPENAERTVQKPEVKVVEENKPILNTKNHETIDNAPTTRDMLERFSDPIVDFFKRDKSNNTWDKLLEGLDLDLGKKPNEDKK